MNSGIGFEQNSHNLRNALNVFLSFLAIYLCKVLLSELMIIKPKYQSTLENHLQCFESCRINYSDSIQFFI